MVFVAQPAGWTNIGQVSFTVGTNQFAPRSASQWMRYRFSDAGMVTAIGTYTSSGGISQSGSISVNVVEHSFSNEPDCWVGKERDWDVPSVATQVVLDGADARLFCEERLRCCLTMECAWG